MDIKIENIVAGMDKYGIPKKTIDGIYYYIVCGRSTNKFLEALISNDFLGITIYVDEDNKHLLNEWAWFLREVFPSESYGSRSKYLVWTNSGGLKGRC